MTGLKAKSLPSIERTLAVFELLAESKKGFSISEISRKLAIPKSSVHLILVTLERRGYLQKSVQTRKYLFGFKLLSLSRMAVETLELCEDSRPLLQSLMQKTGLTVHMAVLEGNEAVIIEKIDVFGPQRITTTWIGRRVSAHCTGIGKALVAFLSEDDFRSQIRSKALWRYNQKTICSFKELRKEIARVRDLGYSLSDEESQVGFRGIGAPIFDHTGKVLAAISVDGTIGQIPPGLISTLGELVKRTATAISVQLGYVPGIMSQRHIPDKSQ